MKAYVYNGHGGPEVESFADVPRPEPGPGQLLIAVHAAGVNPADWKRRSGGMRTPDSPPEHFPQLFGREAAGVVEALGDGADGHAIGDAVFGNTEAGGFSEYALLPVGVTARKPATLSFPDAATLPVAAAWGRQQYTRPLPVIDALLAATARVHGLTVVTRNVKDFELAGAQVLNPFAE